MIEVVSRIGDIHMLTHFIIDHNIRGSSLDPPSLWSYHTSSVASSLRYKSLNIRCGLRFLQFHPLWSLVLAGVLVLVLGSYSISTERKLDFDSLCLL